MFQQIWCLMRACFLVPRWLSFHCIHMAERTKDLDSPFFFLIFFKLKKILTLQYCIGFAIYQHESTTGIHVFPILNPPLSSIPVQSVWVVPVHQPQASSIVHRTWTGDSFHIWYYSCFNAILPSHPTLCLSHRVQKTVLYICVSFAVSYTGFREGNGTPLQYSCLENPMDGGAWWAAVHGVAKSWTRLSDFTFTSHFHALEKEMATHSSVLARRIPGMGKPGGLPSMGSHRVKHDWSDLAAAAAYKVIVTIFLNSIYMR